VAIDAGVKITLNCNDDFVFRNANRSLIFSMFYNVVNNAVKNTPRRGKIEIGGKWRDAIFEVSVIDTGKGMTQKQLDNLFSRFRTKLDPAGDSTGIGLAITKSIADFHDIAIRVLSEPGKGTEFFFFFP
jgi:signal transduction histidine kinase